MDEPHFVGVVQPDDGAEDVMAGAQDIDGAELPDEIVEVDAVDELHDEEMEILVLVDVVGADEIRVVHRSNGPGFAVEPRQRRFVGRLRHRQDLHGDFSLHEFVFAKEHLAHPADAEPLKDFVLPDEESLPLALE